MGASRSRKTVINAPKPEQKKTNGSFETLLQHQMEQDRRVAAAKYEEAAQAQRDAAQYEQARRAAVRMGPQREAAAKYREARRSAGRMGPLGQQREAAEKYAAKYEGYRQAERDAAQYEQARRAASRMGPQSRAAMLKKLRQEKNKRRLKEMFADRQA